MLCSCIATPEPGHARFAIGWPDVLPGNRGVFFTSITLAGSDVSVLDLRSGQRTARHTSRLRRYSPTGHIVFERQGRIEAARFSLSTLTTIGAPSEIMAGVSRGDMLEGPRFAFSRSGALVYVPATLDEREGAAALAGRARPARTRAVTGAPRRSIDVAPDRGSWR